jgi:hypothetical protein
MKLFLIGLLLWAFLAFPPFHTSFADDDSALEAPDTQASAKPKPQAASDEPEELPAEVKLLLLNDHTKDDVLMATNCSVGNKKIRAVGLVLRVYGKKSEDIPLHAYVAYKLGKWQLWELPRKIDYEHGAIANFLGEFWVDKAFARPYGIRCVVPGEDKEISSSANGAFVKPFSKGATPKAKNLCFQASNVYNSWVCASVADTGKKPALSFVQMNAD